MLSALLIDKITKFAVNREKKVGKKYPAVLHFKDCKGD